MAERDAIPVPQQSDFRCGDYYVVKDSDGWSVVLYKPPHQPPHLCNQVGVPFYFHRSTAENWARHLKDL